MNFLSLLSFVAYASEVVLSPVPDDILNRSAYVSPYPTPSFQTLSLADIAAQTFAIIQTPTVTPSTTPSATPSPTTIPKTSKKTSYTVSLLGDSMVDTLGPDAGGLAGLLQEAYPESEFTVINHGLGATNIDTGLDRLTNSYKHLAEIRPAVLSQPPDILVIESFGYNPYPYEEGAIDTHWLTLARIVDTVRARSPGTRIIIAATIAPNARVFGDGAPGIAFTPAEKQARTATIKTYLESTIRFARSQKLPLADAYSPSLGSDGEGNPAYINTGDHIHYSPAGRELMARVIAEAIITNHLPE